MNQLFSRISGPTPPWWRKVRNTAAIVASVSVAVIAAPIALPAAVVSALTTISIIAASVAGTAQCTIEPPAKD